jgi:hypothetical protein
MSVQLVPRAFEAHVQLVVIPTGFTFTVSTLL